MLVPAVQATDVEHPPSRGRGRPDGQLPTSASQAVVSRHQRTQDGSIHESRSAQIDYQPKAALNAVRHQRGQLTNVGQVIGAEDAHDESGGPAVQIGPVGLLKQVSSPSVNV